MEKKKQIEEMASDIAKRDCYLWEHCPKEPKHNCVSQDPKIMLESSKNYITIAIWLVTAGYRKITENAVVLTKKEYDELQKGVKTHNYTAMFDAQDAYRWEQGYFQGSKETAKKFAEMLKKMAYQSTDWSHGEHPMVVEVDYIDEIAEEITGENKDDGV